MKAPKMYHVFYDANGTKGSCYMATDNIQSIERYFARYPVKHTLDIQETEYCIGQIVEFKDTWAEDMSHGTMKKAVICRFEKDRMVIDLGWERFLVYPGDEFKIVGSVPVDEDGYVADWKEARKVLMGEAA